MRYNHLRLTSALVVAGVALSACGSGGGKPAATAQSVAAIFDRGTISMEKLENSNPDVSTQQVRIAVIFDSMIGGFDELSFSGPAQSDVQVVKTSMAALVNAVRSPNANNATITNDAQQVLSADNALRHDLGLSPAKSAP